MARVSERAVLERGTVVVGVTGAGSGRSTIHQVAASCVRNLRPAAAAPEAVRLPMDRLRLRPVPRG